MQTYTYEDTLTVMECGECGISFAVPRDWRKQRCADHKTFYCPNGHARWFPTGTSDEEKAKKRAEDLAQELARANTRALREAESRKAAERSNAALKGVVTRTKRKAAHALCPVGGCGRSFVQVQRHLNAKHPDWVKAHEKQS